MISITGASGQLGRQVVAALLEKKPNLTIVAGTRNPEHIQDLAAQGCVTVAADFDRPETMEAAFKEASVALIICGTSPIDRRIRQHRAAIDAAKRAGVGRVIYTSFINPTRNSLFPFAAVHEDSERYLVESGLAYTILRNNHFVENLDNALALARQSGSLALPGAGGKVAYILRRDVAVATAAVLTESGHENKIYDVTGSEALDLFDVAARASQAWSMKVTARELDTEEYRRVLADRGLPDFAIEAQIGIRLASGGGEYTLVSTDAGRLAGGALTRVDDYLRSDRWYGLAG